MVNHTHWSQEPLFRSHPANLSGDNSGYFCVLLKIYTHKVPTFYSDGHFLIDLIHFDLAVFLISLYSKTSVNANKDLQILVNWEILVSTTQPVFGNTINKSDSSFT